MNSGIAIKIPNYPNRNDGAPHENTAGRLKLAVEAPREMRIERVKAPEVPKKYGKVFRLSLFLDCQRTLR